MHLSSRVVDDERQRSRCLDPNEGRDKAEIFRGEDHGLRAVTGQAESQAQQGAAEAL